MTDKIDKAIQATNGNAETIAMRQFQVTIESTGRPVAILLPVDVTNGEIAEFAGWMLTGLVNTLREERARTAGGRIIIPVGSVPPA